MLGAGMERGRKGGREQRSVGGVGIGNSRDWLSEEIRRGGNNGLGGQGVSYPRRE